MAFTFLLSPLSYTMGDRGSPIRGHPVMGQGLPPGGTLGPPFRFSVLHFALRDSAMIVAESEYLKGVPKVSQGDGPYHP